MQADERMRTGMKYRLQVVSSTDGRDRWLLVKGNGIERAWSAPKWLSLRSWLWRRRDAK